MQRLKSLSKKKQKRTMESTSMKELLIKWLKRKESSKIKMMKSSIGLLKESLTIQKPMLETTNKKTKEWVSVVK